MVRLSLRNLAITDTPITLTIRDRRRRRNDFGKFDSMGKAEVLIVEGAVFTAEKFVDEYTIRSRGSLLSEVVVSVGVSANKIPREKENFFNIPNKLNIIYELFFFFSSGFWMRRSVKEHRFRLRRSTRSMRRTRTRRRDTHGFLEDGVLVQRAAEAESGRKLSPVRTRQPGNSCRRKSAPWERSPRSISRSVTC